MKNLWSLLAVLFLSCPAAAGEGSGVQWGSQEYKLEFSYLCETGPELEERWGSLAPDEQKARLERAKAPAADRYREVAAEYKEAMKKWDIDALTDALEKDTSEVRDTFSNWLGEERARAYELKVNTLRSVLAKAESQMLTEDDMVSLEQYLVPEAVSTIRSIKSAYDSEKKLKPGDPSKPLSADKLTTYVGDKPLSGGKLSTMYDKAAEGGTEVPLPGAAVMGGTSGSVLPLAGSRGSAASTLGTTPPPDIQGEQVKKGPGRLLSQEESVLAREVFGDKIDYAKVKIISGKDMTLWGKILTSGDAAVVWGNTIYFPNDENGQSIYNFQKHPEWFTHEMVHVGQYQGWGDKGKGGWGYAAKSVWEQITQGEEAYSIGTLDPDKPFDDYGIEQQAVIVESYLNTLTGAYGRGHTASPEQKAAMEAILRKKGLYPKILPDGGDE